MPHGEPKKLTGELDLTNEIEHALKEIKATENQYQHFYHEFFKRMDRMATALENLNANVASLVTSSQAAADAAAKLANVPNQDPAIQAAADSISGVAKQAQATADAINAFLNPPAPAPAPAATQP